MMRCERCRRRIDRAALRGRGWRRLVMAAMDRTPEYEMLLCRQCAELVLDFVYRRQSDNEERTNNEEATEHGEAVSDHHS